MPRNAEFYKVLRCFRGIRFFFSKTTQFAKCGKIRQDVPFIRSKIVVKIDLFTTMDILSYFPGFVKPFNDEPLGGAKIKPKVLISTLGLFYKNWNLSLRQTEISLHFLIKYSFYFLPRNMLIAIHKIKFSTYLKI